VIQRGRGIHAYIEHDVRAHTYVVHICVTTYIIYIGCRLKVGRLINRKCLHGKNGFTERSKILAGCRSEK